MYGRIIDGKNRKQQLEIFGRAKKRNMKNIGPLELMIEDSSGEA